MPLSQKDTPFYWDSERVIPSLMYLCNQERFANCLHFDFNSKSHCQQRSICENDGECLPDRAFCPNLSKMTPEEIFHRLCCFEFPFELFYGINLAFYRTFVSPRIATVYTQTKTLERETEKRVNDTNILVHAWIDHGLDSDEGRASFKHLNRIHGAFRNLTRNEDFVFILCCLIVDNIRMIDIFGWRSLNDIGKEAAFRFYELVGERMNLKDRPKSLEDARIIVDDYIDNDIHSKDITFGRVLTNSVTTIVEKWYSPLVPASLIRLVLSAIIYIVGGQKFHQKLG
jgi:hypothetical protein